MTEHHEQAAVVQWLLFRRIPHFAVPNAARRSFGLARRMQAEGLSKGVPDLILPCHLVAIEMKATKGGRLAPEQRAWLDLLEGAGWRVKVAHGAKEAVEWLDGLKLC
jgi:VRR-NUC domain